MEWKAKVGLPVVARPPGLDLPRMKQKQYWSHGKENGCGGASAGAGLQGWESAAGHRAWPEGRAVAHSAFRTPAALLLGHSGCTPPGRSHHGRGRGQRLTCLEREGRGVIRRGNTMDTHISDCRRGKMAMSLCGAGRMTLHYEKMVDHLT